MKRNRESKARIKLIQEQYYNKFEQRALDRYAKGTSYHELYKSFHTYGYEMGLNFVIAMDNLNRATERAACSINEFADAMGYSMQALSGLGVATSYL